MASGVGEEKGEAIMSKRMKGGLLYVAVFSVLVVLVWTIINGLLFISETLGYTVALACFVLYILALFFAIGWFTAGDESE